MSDSKIQDRVLCRILSVEQMELVGGGEIIFTGDFQETTPKNDKVDEDETEEN